MSLSVNALSICSIISLVSCIVVTFSIASDPTSQTSRHLALVFRLVICGIGLSLSLLIYNLVAQYSLSDASLNTFCNAFLPFPMYFFVASFGWTVLIAFRFRSTKSWFLGTEKKYEVPYWVVWSVSLMFVFPAIITCIAFPGNIAFVLSSPSTNMCVYNHENIIGKYIDIFTLQLPLAFTIIVNLYSYGRGLFALRDSPHSVLARHMRKAGGYLFILIIVWVPNIVYNLYSIFLNTNTDLNGFQDFGFCMAALQVQPSVGQQHFVCFCYLPIKVHSFILFAPTYVSACLCVILNLFVE